LIPATAADAPAAPPPSVPSKKLPLIPPLRNGKKDLRFIGSRETQDGLSSFE
jgi:hypothetical protein